MPFLETIELTNSLTCTTEVVLVSSSEFWMQCEFVFVHAFFGFQ